VQPSDYERVERAIRFIDERYRDQPRLEEVAVHVGLSPFHFQRLFRRWAGVSPKRFLQLVTAGHARHLLRSAGSTLDTAWDVGLSSPSRLHDLMVSIDAVTPGEVGSRGEGLVIRYGGHQTPFGRCLIAVTDRGVCALHFLDGDGSELLTALAADWPAATLQEDRNETGRIVERIFAARSEASKRPLPLLLKGTNFQVKVWEALLRIPPGAAATYGDVAEAIGAQRAVRAVGTAVGRNPVAYLIPCHRVLRSTGALGGYRWGTERKRAMLAWESARIEEPA
jgi:AraC family transcriptional regulator, regulatory protein of adaptative response / methylated-DNA-[protein]-cysteine methyltransferase